MILNGMMVIGMMESFQVEPQQDTVKMIGMMVIFMVAISGVMIQVQIVLGTVDISIMDIIMECKNVFCMLINTIPF